MKRDFNFETQCPYCGVTNDGLLATTGNTLPGDGDVLFCFSCGTFSVWHDAMKKPTPNEFQFIAGNMYLQAVQLTWMEQTNAE